MKVKKWLLAIAAFAVMAMVCAVAAGAEAYGNFEYGVLDDGTVEITGYKGSEQKVDVPEKINKKSVTRIGNLAFKNCTKITSIAMPDSVVYIGRSAFYNCTSLKSITIPDSVTSIGSYAFEGCTSLRNVTIPNSVTSIGEDAFCSCTNLKDIYYTGTKAEWDKISIDIFNDCLTNATIHFSSISTPKPTPTPTPSPAPTQPTTTTPTTSAKAVAKPKSAKFKKVKSAKKAISVEWKKVRGVKGYQVQVATDKKFKKNKKTVTIKKQKTTKTTVKKLKAKKKYYVRVRTYKIVNGKKVYSSWSKVKSVKTK